MQIIIIIIIIIVVIIITCFTLNLRNEIPGHFPNFP